MNAWQITRKDLLLLFRDKRALITLVALPILLITVVGLSTGKLFDWKTRSESYTLAIVDLAETDASRRLVERIEKLDAVDPTRVSSARTAKEFVDSERTDACLVIGLNFPERVAALKLRDVFRLEDGRLREGLPSLDITFDGGGRDVAPLVSRLLFSAAVSSVLPDVAKKYPLTRRLVEDRPEDDENPPPATAATAGSEKKKRSGSRIYQFAVPTYTVLFVFFLITVMGRSFLQERDLGTLRRLQLAPITNTAIIFGKTVPFLLISVLQTAVLFVSGRVLFGMSWGQQPVLLLPVLVCTSLAATALGLLFATVVKSDNQVSAYGNLIVLGAASISGCLTPRSWLPEIMQKISLITPHAWALEGYRELLSGEAPDLMVVMTCCLALLAFAATFFTLGLVRFRHLQD